MRRLNWKHKRLTRDGFLFVFGLGGIAYETIFVHADRPSLLFVFGACIGLPAFLHSDEKSEAPKAPEKPKFWGDEPKEHRSHEPSPPTKKTPAKRPTKKAGPTKKPAPRRRS